MPVGLHERLTGVGVFPSSDQFPLGRAYGREVLLMHDIKQATTRALPQILDWIDAENARREQSHKKPIRIVDAPALAVERLPRGLTAWLGDATAGARALPAALASVLP